MSSPLVLRSPLRMTYQGLSTFYTVRSLLQDKSRAVAGKPREAV